MYTSAQAASIQHLDGPLLISAGAGSGKTFTLSQRIASAFKEGSGEGDAPFLDDIDSVLAITFTDKAANEIKARVRAALRSINRVDQALKVDSAWISTIHSMCARILREHALEIGIDPGFTVLSENREKEIRNLCIEDVLNEQEGEEGDASNRLFAEYGVRTGQNGTSVEAMLEEIFKTAAGLEQGLDAFSFGPEAPTPGALAREALAALDQVVIAAEEFCATSTKSNKTAQNARVAAQQAQASLENILGAAEQGKEPIAREERADLTYDNLARNLQQFETIPTFGSLEDKALVKEMRSTIVRVAGDIDRARARRHGITLMVLARKVESAYLLRLQQEGSLDHDGILRTTLAAFRAHPKIARLYADKFKLVMVDEFQDTNQLQIEMITLLAGENNSRLCTVGDSQQSLYGFRGADLQVYEQHKEYMRSDSVRALEVRLDSNFRSHGDILTFVERVFSQQRAFGNDFLALDEGRNPQRIKAPYVGSAPRLDMVFVEGEKGVKSLELIQPSAEAIADRFCTLREEGHEPRDMVVLLGRMTNASSYAIALRDKGFDCAVTGGSGFGKTPEAQLVGNLLYALLNPADTQALFGVLQSPLFALSADEFILLSTANNEQGGMSSRGIDAGVEILAKIGLHEESPRLALALQVFSRAKKFIGVKPPSWVVSQVLAESGVFFRLESCGVEGMAQAADLLKAIRLITSLEAGGKGLACVAQAYGATLGNIKEPPGTLTPSENNFVQIMTIHASKGLEFPIVALAEFDIKHIARNSELVTEQISGRVYASVMPSSKNRIQFASGTWKYESPDEVEPNPVSASLTGGPFLYHQALLEYGKQWELAEQRRKFYVGATRAAEALILVVTKRQSANREIHADICEALFGGCEFPVDELLVDYGAVGPLRFSRTTVQVRGDSQELDSQAQEGNGEEKSSLQFIVPAIKEEVFYSQIAYRALRRGVFSYSSIADAPADEKAKLSESLQPADILADDEAWSAIQASLASDADKATDLGTAFHAVAQLAASERGDSGEFSWPSQTRIGALEKRCRLSADQKVRLRQALSCWFASDIAKHAATFNHIRAEAPFLVGLECGGGTCYLEGEIDLLCSNVLVGEQISNKEPSAAFVVDYKTGGDPEETPEDLYNKHLKQATCYAYALIVKGFDCVDLAFVRVEQLDLASPNQPQVVRYSFTSDEREGLAAYIRQAYSDAR